MLLILSIRALLCSIALDRSEREKLFPLLTAFLQRLSVSLSSPLPLAAKYVFISVLVVIEVRVLIVHRYSGRSRGRRSCCRSSAKFQSVVYIADHSEVFKGTFTNKKFTWLENLFLEVFSFTFVLIFSPQALECVVAEEFFFNTDLLTFPLTAARHTPQLFSAIGFWGKIMEIAKSTLK